MPDNAYVLKTKRIRWTARIWSIPIILYALIFFFGYVWGLLTTGTADPYAVEDVPFIESLPPLLMFAGIIGLAIAWKWERIGAIIALLFHVLALAFLLVLTPITADFPRSGIPYLLVLLAATPGILFLAAHSRTET